MVDGWGWESLPDIYKRSPYPYDNCSALLKYSGLSASENGPNEVTPDSGPGEADNGCFIDEMISVTELPVKNISCIDINVGK